MDKLKAITKSKLDKWLPIMLIVVGVIGTIAAFVILYEKIHLLQNPNYKPACSINPIISCGSVMQSDQSNVFGFPNPIIGLVGFPVLVVTGVVLLGGAKLKHWYWLGLNVGLLLGVAFLHWLFFQSVYRIGALCPYCMVVWTVTIAGFWYVTLYNIQHGHIKVKNRFKKLTSFIRKHHLDILVLWYLIILALILQHFWYYFGKDLPF